MGDGGREGARDDAGGPLGSHFCTTGERGWRSDGVVPEKMEGGGISRHIIMKHSGGGRGGGG